MNQEEHLNEDRWFQDWNNLILTANYMKEEGCEVSDILDLMEKPWHYEAEYLKAKEQKDA